MIMLCRGHQALRGAPREVLEAGEWPTVRTFFEAALQQEETGRFGLRTLAGPKRSTRVFETSEDEPRSRL